MRRVVPLLKTARSQNSVTRCMFRMGKVLPTHKGNKTNRLSLAWGNWGGPAERAGSVLVAPGWRRGRATPAGPAPPALPCSSLHVYDRDTRASGKPNTNLRDEDRGPMPKYHAQLRVMSTWQLGPVRQALSEGVSLFRFFTW